MNRIYRDKGMLRQADMLELLKDWFETKGDGEYPSDSSLKQKLRNFYREVGAEMQFPPVSDLTG
jgi:hypothetical protein